jgi:hypothetical protein
MVNTWATDWNYQYYSPFFERETGVWMEKLAVVKLGLSYHLPLEKTFSCTQGLFFHCGKCNSCRSRREVLIQAGMIANQQEESVSKILAVLPNARLHLGLRQRWISMGQWVQRHSVLLREWLALKLIQ